MVEVLVVQVLVVELVLELVVMFRKCRSPNS
jgi:hypothetical protein